MNHLHSWDLLPGTGEEDVEEVRQLGEVVVNACRAGSRVAFPDREFDVALVDDYGPTIEAVSRPRPS